MSAAQGYVLACRDGDGGLVADWDGVVHRTLAEATAELRRANDTACCDLCAYQVYALVTP